MSVSTEANEIDSQPIYTPLSSSSRRPRNSLASLKTKQTSSSLIRISARIGLLSKSQEISEVRGGVSQLYQAAARSEANLRKHIDKLNEAAVSCIIEDGRRFGDFGRPGMRDFLDVAVPGYKGPLRHTVRRRLSTLYHEKRDRLRDTLSTILDISLTTDIWSSCSRFHFICLTAHYFNDSFGYMSTVIGFRRLRGRKVAKRLKKHIFYEIKNLKIQSKIRSITTDSGSDIKSATGSTAEFGTRIVCLAHNLNLIVTTGLCLWRKPTEKKQSRIFEKKGNATTRIAYADGDYEIDENLADGGNDCSTEYDFDDDSLKNKDETSSKEEDLIEESQADDDEQSSEIDDLERCKEFELLMKINSLLQDVRAMITSIRRSSIIQAHVRTQAKNQLHYELKRIHQMANDSAVAQDEKSRINLNTTELDAVLKRCLCTKFTYYFETVLPTKQQELALVASYFHPFTYKYLKDDEKREAEKLSFADIQREKAVCTSETSQPSPPSVQSQTTTKKQNSQIDIFLFIRGLSIDSTAVMDTDKKILFVREELANYVSRVKPDFKFETFWSENKHDLKCLASLVCRYNVIPATSVASESAFSIAGYIQRKQRASLLSSTLKYSMFLRDKVSNHS
ncbi:unnamed protein product [Didymodactylos carnosus]|uniref:HAT C-terminal dimerisation domain-containing protein n=1 Tax=Didymodactylos carnosus TaxID=1234261 RepID=A0A815U365_9BILA|nr:unnamed protein product [Didymodactylos carnosus]CAF4374305.1 unnamed protein product [Didymodactylos carnosus]